MPKTCAEELGFLAAIRADRDSDGPLLIYADWLEERGELPRAEFVRLGVERARWTPGSPRHEELAKAQVGLEVAMGNTEGDWVERRRGASRPSAMSGVNFWGTERGLPREVEFAQGKTLVREGARAVRESVADQMTISGQWNNAGGKALGEFPHWGAFRHLALWQRSDRGREIGRFLGDVGPGLPRSLGLSGEGHGYLDVLELIGSSQWARTERLVLQSTHLLRHSSPRLAEGLEQARSLKDLVVTHSSIEAPGPDSVLRRLGGTSIVSLVLRQFWQDYGRGAFLMREGDWSGLKSLEVADLSIGLEGTTDFVKSGRIAGLESLVLANVGLWADGARALASTPQLTNLRRLDLRGNAIGAAGAHALASSPALSKLESLLVECPEEGTGRAALRERWPFVAFHPRPLYDRD